MASTMAAAVCHWSLTHSSLLEHMRKSATGDVRKAIHIMKNISYKYLTILQNAQQIVWPRVCT